MQALKISRMMAVIAALVVPLLARAADPPAFRKAVQSYEALDYEKAAPRFRRLMKNAALDKEVRARSAVYLGVIHLAMGRESKARETFETALSLYPEVELPLDASPAIQEVFEEVKARAGLGGSSGEGEGASPDEGEGGTTGESDEGASEGPPPYQGGGDEGEGTTTALPPPPPGPAEEPLMHHQPPAPSDRPGTIVVTLDPLRRVDVARIEVHHRRAGESFWFTTPATSVERDRFQAEVPAPSPEGAIEYYLEAYGPDGSVVAVLGSEATPFRYEVPRPAPSKAVDAGGEPSPRKEGSEGAEWYRQWWAWTAAGAVVAGVVGGIVLATSGGCKAPDGQGCVEVTIR